MEKNKCFFSIKAIKQAVKDEGSYWFSAHSMRHFNCRVLSKVYKGQYFITSERKEWNDCRKYTIRMIDLATHDIDTIGEFMGFNTWQQAVKEIDRLPSP